MKIKLFVTFLLMLFSLSVYSAVNKLDASKAIKLGSVTEPLLSTDVQNKLNSGGGSATELNDLNDVNTTSPSLGDFFIFDGSNWINLQVTLDELSDCDINNPIFKNVLYYDGSSWVNQQLKLNDLFSVQLTLPSSAGQFFMYDGSNWINYSAQLDDLNDTNINSPVINQVLKFDGSNWINSQLLSTDIDYSTKLTVNEVSLNIDDLNNVSLNSPSTNQVLTWNGSSWINQDTQTEFQNLNDLNDVSVVNTEAESLIYDGTNWINRTTDMTSFYNIENVTTNSNDSYIDNKLYLVVPNVIYSYNSEFIEGYGTLPSNDFVVKGDYSNYFNDSSNFILRKPDGSEMTYAISSYTYDNVNDYTVITTTTSFSSQTTYNNSAKLFVSGGDYDVSNSWLGVIFLYKNNHKIVIHNCNISRTDFSIYNEIEKKYTYYKKEVFQSKYIDNKTITLQDDIIYPYDSIRKIFYDSNDDKFYCIRPYHNFSEIYEGSFTPAQETILWNWLSMGGNNSVAIGGIANYDQTNKILYYGLGSYLFDYDTYNNNIYTDFSKYDINTDTYTTLSSPIEESTYADSILYNNKIYMFGGKANHNTHTIQNTNWIMDSAGAFTAAENIGPEQKLHGNYTYNINETKLYEFGGLDTSIEQNDINNYIFATINSPANLSGFGDFNNIINDKFIDAVVLCGNDLNGQRTFYVFGGIGLTGIYLNKLQKVYYDGANWTCSDYSLNLSHDFCGINDPNNVDIMYLAGGILTDGTLSNQLIKYDVSTDPPTVTTLSDIPTAVKNAQIIYDQGYLYLLGGIDSSDNYIDTIQIYDITNNTWSTSTNTLKEARAYFGAAGDNNGNALIAWGKDSSGFLNDSYVLNLSTGATSNQHTESTPVQSINPFVYYNGNNYYICGGYDNTQTKLGPSNYIQEYDIATDTWKILDVKLPRYLAKMSVINNNNDVYIVGGELDDASTINTTYHCDLSNINDNMFSELSNVPSNIKNSSISYYNGYVYLIGGNNGSNNISNVYKYNISSNTWITLSNTLNKEDYDVQNILVNNKLYLYNFNDDSNKPQYIDLTNDNISNMSITDSAGIIYLYPYNFTNNFMVNYEIVGRNRTDTGLNFNRSLTNSDYFIYTFGYIDNTHVHNLTTYFSLKQLD